jgi:hypothetical protein
VRSLSRTHLVHVAGRLLGGRATIDEAAQRREILCEAEETEVEPPVFLKAQLDNVRALTPLTTREQEDLRLYARRLRHAPTVAYWVRDVTLADSGFYSGRWSRYLTRNAAPGPSNRVRRMDEPSALATSLLGGQFFGHWMHSDAPTYLLAERFGAPVTTRYPDWPDQSFYAAAFQQDWAPVDRGRFSELVVFDDFAQNSLRRSRYETLRARLRERVRPNRPGGLVYLRRGETGASRRVMVNEAEISNQLAREGFTIVDLARDGAAQISATLLDARLMVSVEGSHQSHALHALSACGGIVSIVPPDFFCNAARDWSAALGMRYGLVVGEAHGREFRVDERALLKTVELMLAAIDTGRDGAVRAAVAATTRRDGPG